jgi:hypothetical protein
VRVSQGLYFFCAGKIPDTQFTFFVPCTAHMYHVRQWGQVQCLAHCACWPRALPFTFPEQRFLRRVHGALHNNADALYALMGQWRHQGCQRRLSSSRRLAHLLSVPFRVGNCTTTCLNEAMMQGSEKLVYQLVQCGVCKNSGAVLHWPDGLACRRGWHPACRSPDVHPGRLAVCNTMSMVHAMVHVTPSARRHAVAAIMIAHGAYPPSGCCTCEGFAACDMCVWHMWWARPHRRAWLVCMATL